MRTLAGGARVRIAFPNRQVASLFFLSLTFSCSSPRTLRSSAPPRWILSLRALLNPVAAEQLRLEYLKAVKFHRKTRINVIFGPGNFLVTMGCNLVYLEC